MRVCKPTRGWVAEWLMAADCKSARASVRWFESSPFHHPALARRGWDGVLRTLGEGGLRVVRELRMAHAKYE